MITTPIRPTAVIAVLTALCIGCAPALTTSEKFRERESARIRAVFAQIDESNRTEKKSIPWLTTAYASIGIKNIHDIPPQELLWISLQTRAATALGIILLKIAKPDLGGSLLTIGVAIVLGVASALPVARRERAQEGPAV